VINQLKYIRTLDSRLSEIDEAMKFFEQLERHAVPEWRSKYIDYVVCPW
jgi:hypothetical protein